MATSGKKNSGEDDDKAGKLILSLSETQKALTALYPDAHCIKRNKSWFVFGDGKAIAHSYLSEEIAWDWALKVTNRKILEKFGKI